MFMTHVDSKLFHQRQYCDRKKELFIELSHGKESERFALPER